MTISDRFKCPDHPEYDGKKEPTRKGCDYCWFIFWTKQAVPECFLRSKRKGRLNGKAKVQTSPNVPWDRSTPGKL